MNICVIFMALNKKEASKYLLDKVERIEAFEEKLGIRYESISIMVDYYDFNDDPWTVTILGDVIEHENGNLANFQNWNIETVVNLYDEENRIIASGGSSFQVRDYLGFTTFKVYMEIASIEEVKRIRIYPR